MARRVSNSAFVMKQAGRAQNIAGLVFVYLAPPAALVASVQSGNAVTAWAVMEVPMLRYYRRPLWIAPLLPFTAFLYLVMTVDSVVLHHRGRGAAWKGRTYARPEGTNGLRATPGRYAEEPDNQLLA